MEMSSFQLQASSSLDSLLIPRCNNPTGGVLDCSYYNSLSTKAVWVANRNIPILDKSASLRTDSSDGNLKIFHISWENPTQISWVQGARNTSVTRDNKVYRVLRWQDCSCVAYAATNRANGTGCEIWSRETEFIQSYDYDDNDRIFVEFIPPVIAEKKEKKWWIARIGLVIAVAVALLVILLCSLSYIARRKYKGKEEKWWQSLMVDLLVPLLCYFWYLPWRGSQYS
ncbi:hypothetical protein QYF36_000698 [Acer negundo]|nr:hypothetical protein QYF36_000698 [Acer negundo]